MPRRSAWPARVGAALLASAALVPAAHAGLFDDDEARRAILDVRQRLDQASEQSRQRAAETKALTEQVEQLRNAVLELNGQLEALRAENARLRGQDEQLLRDVAEVQRVIKDTQQGVDDRMRRLEPQKAVVDGREFLADPEEKKQYDEAMATFRRGEFGPAAAALSAFARRFPNSGFADSARFWLGNAQYGSRQYRDAITTFRNLVNAQPNSEKAPEALLSIANCQLELKDSKSARRTIDELVKAYPKSEAAQAGRERLASLR